MDFEERRQEEHTISQILSEDPGETSRQRLDIDPSLSAGSEQGESSFDEKTVEYNMNITIDIVETDYQEVENEFVDSIVEIEDSKAFPCSKCGKICKSKGGLTKHTNSKHSDASPHLYTTPLCLDTLKSIVDTIKRNIVAEKLYGDEIDSVVNNISATELFLKEVLPLYTKFCRNKNQDKLLESFYGLMLNSSTLLNYKDS